MDFHPSQMVTGTARPWCVWKLSSWVVASFVIPTWRFRRWGWNVMDGFDPLKTKSFWFPKKCGFGHFEGLKGKMVWSFWGLVHIQPCCFGRWLFFHLFAGFLCCHFEVPVVTFQGCMARWFLFCFFLPISSWMECQCLHAHEVMPYYGLANMSWNVLMPVAGIQNSHQCRNAPAEGPWNTEATMSDDILMPSLMLKGCNNENIKLLWMNRVMERFYRRTQQRWDASIAKVLWVHWSMHKQALTCELCEHKAKQDISTFYIAGSQVVFQFLCFLTF